MCAMVALLALVPSLLAGCPRPSPRPSGCDKDSDCKGARICSRHRTCVEPPPGSAARVGAARDASVPAQPDAAPRQPGAPPFAMFGGDAQNSGRLAGPAPERKPAELWSVTTGGPIVGSPTVGPDGTVFVGSHDAKLYAVSPDGAVRWTLTTGDRIWGTPAVAEDGTVYIGSDDDHLYAVNGATGELLWRFRVGPCDPPMGFGPVGSRCDVDGGPTIGPDGTIYTGGDGVYAIWPDGTLRWKFATPEHVIAAPALAPPGSPHPGTVYAGCLDDAVYAIWPDGTKAWEVRTQRDIESSPAVAPDGTIYAGSHDGGLYAVSPEGEVKWRFAAADKVHGSPAVTTTGAVLFGSQDDHLYAVSPRGALLWYIAFDSDVDAAPAVSAEGVVYAASDDKTLRAFR